LTTAVDAALAVAGATARDISATARTTFRLMLSPL
jgi:hypothetical protein